MPKVIDLKSYKGLMRSSNSNEVCVCCSKETDIPKLRVISDRLYFIPGVGQLCPTCYKQLYTSQYS